MSINPNFVSELRWRGMIHDIMPGAEEQLQKEPTSVYVGFDPTADSLHVGHLVSVMILKHLQKAGHKPLALVGGATGMVGDPSFKSEERVLLSEETLRHNVASLQGQLSKFLDFEGENAAELVNNYDWFKDMTFLAFIRDIGKHITVNYMMSKDSVKKRLETGISFTEFTYQLLQGYDFFHLYKHKNCKVQMGGSDQWGNIVTGTELIRRMAGGEAYAMTCPLITRPDGTKFGKSEGGQNVWLDPEKTSPYKFYQFWLNVSDAEAEKFIKIFTLLSPEEIEALIAEHAQAPHLRLLQKALAADVTARVHSQADLEMAVKASEILFGKDVTEALRSIDERTLLQVFEGVPQVEVSAEALSADVTELLAVSTNVFSSKGEARKMIQGGGVSINKEKIASADQPAADFELLQGKYLLAQKGKKNYYLIKVVG